VLAVHHRVADPEVVPRDTTRQVEEAGAEVAANRIGIHVAVTRGTREEQARPHVPDRLRAGELAHILVAVRRADERAGIGVILRPDGIADGAGNADTFELTGISHRCIPVVILAVRRTKREAGDRRRTVLDVLLALVQPVAARA